MVIRNFNLQKSQVRRGKTGLNQSLTHTLLSISLTLYLPLFNSVAKRKLCLSRENIEREKEFPPPRYNYDYRNFKGTYTKAFFPLNFLQVN
jgi:predicted YcjX-like family ATPase